MDSESVSMLNQALQRRDIDPTLNRMPFLKNYINKIKCIYYLFFS